MKVFFYLLLLTNLLFLLTQWLYPYEQFMQPQLEIAEAKRIRLLDESANLESSTVNDSQLTAAAGNSDLSKPGPADNGRVPDRLCYTLGPFGSSQDVQEAALRFRQSGIDVSSRSSNEQEYRGMMVYLGGFASRTEAQQATTNLKQDGIADFLILDDGERNNIVSLGVFSLKKNAERQHERVKKLGYPVHSEARYREKTIYWLDYSEDSKKNAESLIQRLSEEFSVSRLSRDCAS